MYKVPAAHAAPPARTADRAAYRRRRRFLVAGLLAATAMAMRYGEIILPGLRRGALATCDEPAKTWLIALAAVPAILLAAGLGILALHHAPDARRFRRFTGSIAAYWVMLMLFAYAGTIIRPWKDGRGAYVAGRSFPCKQDIIRDSFP